MPRTLVFEGRDDSELVKHVCRANGVEIPADVQFDLVGGVEQILSGLPIRLKARPGDIVGVVLDADSQPKTRWNTVRGSLEKAGFTGVPATLPADGLVLGGASSPTFGLWMMPDNSSPGFLENFAATLIPNGDLLWDAAIEATAQAEKVDRKFKPVARPKAHLRTWLAWQATPGTPPGAAVRNGYLDGTAAGAQPIARWISALFEL
ncbi:MAG: DUF3226 domain-containing protein [Dehalococcoidia bacterium]